MSCLGTWYTSRPLDPICSYPFPLQMHLISRIPYARVLKQNPQLHYISMIRRFPWCHLAARYFSGNKSAIYFVWRVQMNWYMWHQRLSCKFCPLQTCTKWTFEHKSRKLNNKHWLACVSNLMMNIMWHKLLFTKGKEIGLHPLHHSTCNHACESFFFFIMGNKILCGFNLTKVQIGGFLSRKRKQLDSFFLSFSLGHSNWTLSSWFGRCELWTLILQIATASLSATTTYVHTRHGFSLFQALEFRRILISLFVLIEMRKKHDPRKQRAEILIKTNMWVLKFGLVWFRLSLQKKSAIDRHQSLVFIGWVAKRILMTKKVVWFCKNDK